MKKTVQKYTSGGDDAERAAWIPVSELLPVMLREVMVAYESDDDGEPCLDVGTATRMSDGKWHSAGTFYAMGKVPRYEVRAHSNRVVTHWMPLPAAQHQRILAARAGSGEPVGSLHISHFRDNPSMENVDFQLIADLKPGSYKLYTHPADQVAEGTAQVPVELLELIDEAMCDFLGEDDPLREQLRAILGVKP